MNPRIKQLIIDSWVDSDVIRFNYMGKENSIPKKSCVICFTDTGDEIIELIALKRKK